MDEKLRKALIALGMQEDASDEDAATFLSELKPADAKKMKKFEDEIAELKAKLEDASTA